MILVFVMEYYIMKMISFRIIFSKINHLSKGDKDVQNDDVL